MRAHLPPYAEDDPFVWVKDACNGAGAYFRQSRCVRWPDGRWMLKEAAEANAARGVSPAEMDARTRSGTSAPKSPHPRPECPARDDVRSRRSAVIGDDCYPGG